MYFYGIRFLDIFFSILVQSYKSRFFFIERNLQLPILQFALIYL